MKTQRTSAVDGGRPSSTFHGGNACPTVSLRLKKAHDIMCLRIYSYITFHCIIITLLYFCMYYSLKKCTPSCNKFLPSASRPPSVFLKLNSCQRYCSITLCEACTNRLAVRSLSSGRNIVKEKHKSHRLVYRTGYNDNELKYHCSANKLNK